MDKPTIPERYSRAIESGHLEVRPGVCDVDMLIAAGWAKEGLGTALFRLRTEFDTVNRRELEQCATSLTARVLTLAQMTTLPTTRAALGRFACAHATRVRFMRDDRAVLHIAGRALDLWLDPLCPHCSGRGFNGGFGAPIQICPKCHGTKLRSPRLDATNDGHEFGRSLLVQMDRKTERVREAMSRFLRRPL